MIYIKSLMKTVDDRKGNDTTYKIFLTNPTEERKDKETIEKSEI